MARLSFIAKCFLWLAALLAPAQPSFALRCQCEHGAAEHVEHRHGGLHGHQHGGPGRYQQADCSAENCDAHALSTSRPQCRCDHHFPPQLSDWSAHQLRTQVAVHWGEVPISARSAQLTLQSVQASADARQTATAQQICVVLCRFLT